jgi:preprotein translocase SecE subunit
MAKKAKKPENDFLSTSEDKVVAPKKDAKPVKKKDKKPNFFKRLGGKIKDVFSELKRVSWPTFGKVVKKTGIVIVVVLAFLIVISLFDLGLLELLKLVSPSVGA